MNFEIERMSNEFTRYHLNKEGELDWPFRPMINHFTAPDIGGPHDHPWGFTSLILEGSLKAVVYKIEEDGSWSKEVTEYKKGDCYSITAEHIHEIVELPEGVMTANKGDFIIKGIQGEFYPCKPDIFEKSYELVD